MSMKQAVFQVGNEEYGFDIMNVNTVEKNIKMEQAANSPSNVKGIIRLRGDVIPVYSLRKKFGLEDKQSDEETRLIITNSNGIQIAYEVDRMHGISNVETQQLNDVPSILKSRNTSYMKQVTSLDGRLVVLLDEDGILVEEEQNALKTMISKMKTGS